MMRSGFSLSIASKLASRKVETLGFVLTSRGRVEKPDTPTIRSGSPSRYRISLPSSDRQTIRDGKEEDCFANLSSDIAPPVASLGFGSLRFVSPMFRERVSPMDRRATQQQPPGPDVGFHFECAPRRAC